MSGTIRVLVADDHEPTREGIRQALEDHGFSVCAEAADAEEAVRWALRERPDICLLAVRMPGNGLTAAAEIADTLPATAVVMLTVSTLDSDLFTALRVGAAGYLLKGMAADRLAFALRGVLAGEAAIPRQLVARLVEEFRSREQRRRIFLPGRVARLSEREWEVLWQMRDGRSTAEIADALALSPVTVRRHIAGTLRKLRVPDRESALRLLEQAEAHDRP